MVQVLCASVPLERVYSVFALDSIAHAFAEAWARLTGVKLDEDPEYYSAKLTHCKYKPFQTINRSYIMRARRFLLTSQQLRSFVMALLPYW